MKKEDLRGYAGRYRLVRMVIGGKDLSEGYIKGWEDRSLYMYFEITEDGELRLKAHAGETEKTYEYYLDPEEMRYHLREDMSDEGTAIRLEEGKITEDTGDHLMVYELTDEIR